MTQVAARWAGCARSDWDGVESEGTVVAGGVAGGLGGDPTVVGKALPEPKWKSAGEREAIIPGVVAGDGEGVALVVLAVGPLIMDAVYEGFVGVVEGRLAGVFQARVGVGDAAGEAVLERWTETHLQGVVDGACVVWSEELVDVGEGLGADVEAPWSCPGATPPRGAGTVVPATYLVLGLRLNSGLLGFWMRLEFRRTQSW